MKKFIPGMCRTEEADELRAEIEAVEDPGPKQEKCNATITRPWSNTFDACCGVHDTIGGALFHNSGRGRRWQDSNPGAVPHRDEPAQPAAPLTVPALPIDPEADAMADRLLRDAREKLQPAEPQKEQPSPEAMQAAAEALRTRAETGRDFDVPTIARALDAFAEQKLAERAAGLDRAREERRLNAQRAAERERDAATARVKELEAALERAAGALNGLSTGWWNTSADTKPEETVRGICRLECDDARAALAKGNNNNAT